jgi:hypothetical protein
MKLSFRLKEDWFQLVGIVFSLFLAYAFGQAGLIFGVLISVAFVVACVYLQFKTMNARWCEQCRVLKAPQYVGLDRGRTKVLYICGKCGAVTDASIVIGGDD